MSTDRTTQSGLQGQQREAYGVWEAKDGELVGQLAKLFWLAGLLAGAERDELEEVLGGQFFLPDSLIETAEAGALGVMNEHQGEQGDRVSLFRVLSQLASEAIAAHSEAGAAACEFVQAMEAELRRLDRKYRIER